MDPDITANYKPSAPRKVKFKPKAPPKREAKLVLPKPEKTEIDADDAKAEHLLRRLNETSAGAKPKPKPERKVSQAQVAFGVGASAQKSYSHAKRNNGNQGISSEGGVVEKEYKEPWDYYSYYPVTLPLRRPYSGNPELLDQEEFKDDPQATTYNENDSNHAEELGLLDAEGNNELFFFQVPKILPMFKELSVTDAQEPSNSSNPRKNSRKSRELSSLDEFPEKGVMGKLLIYKSGAMKLKIGDTPLQISAGLSSVFAQEVVALNRERKTYCELSEITKRGIISVDIDHMLGNL